MLDGFIKFWQMVTAPDQAGRTKIMCSQHNNFPGWCFHLHHPELQRP